MAAIVTAFQSTSVVKNWKMILNFKGVCSRWVWVHAHRTEKRICRCTGARKGVAIFAIGVVLVLILDLLLSFFRRGMEKDYQPQWSPDDYVDCSFIDHDCGESSKHKFNSGSVFRAGLMGVVAILVFRGWLQHFLMLIRQSWSMFWQSCKWCAFAVWLYRILVFLVIMSPAATVAAIMPLGVTLVFLHLILLQFLPVLVVILLYRSESDWLCGVWQNWYYQNWGFVINHSYIRPGFVMVISQVFLPT